MAIQNNVSLKIPDASVKNNDSLDHSSDKEDEAPKEDLMASFMIKVELVNKTIDLINQCNERITNLTNKRFDVALGEEEKKNSDEIANIIEKSETARQEIKKTLEEMNKDIDETIERLEGKTNGQEPPEVRSKKQMLSTLSLKFKETLRMTNKIQMEYQRNAQNKIKRQLKIVKPDLSEDQLEELSKDADTGKRLINDMIMGPHASLTAAVSDIKQKYEDVLKLEKSVMQVHKMFEDLAILVHEQVGLMDNIESNVKAATNYLEKSEKHLQNAKKWYQQSRTVIFR